MRAKDIFLTIRSVARQVSKKPIVQLRIEEELLIELSQNSDHSRKDRAEALSRVAEINKSQIELLGGTLTVKSRFTKR